MKIKTDLAKVKKGDYVKYQGSIHKVFKVVSRRIWLRKVKENGG